MGNLRQGWARTEMKIQPWDAAGRKATAEIQWDLETMKRLQELGVPYVISVWRLPERFYVDAFERPRGERFRVIDVRKWDELNDLIGSYLRYAKQEFGVEPDLFSFNEPNIGVQVGQSPEQHAEQIRVMGAAFRQMGFKTKMLLADAVPARDSHVFALEAANSSEALQYVARLGFTRGAAPRRSSMQLGATWPSGLAFHSWSPNSAWTRRRSRQMPGTPITTASGKRR